MVEPQIVILVVAGSSPVGHPIFSVNDLRLQQVKVTPKVTPFSLMFINVSDVF